MQAEEVKQIIERELEGSTVFTTGQNCDFQVIVVGECFAGLTPVKKQQLVYACLHDLIASQAIHAVSIKTYTPEQWAALQ